MAELVDLAADVRAILGSGTKLSYAADWSEYFGHHPQDGSGDVFFHLDPLWADARSTSSASTTTCRSPTGATASTISTPRAPTRSPTSTTCAATSRAARASTGSTPAPPIARRRFGRRSPTAPHGKPWVFRYKDLPNWWSNPHRNRPGGVESGATTAWVPESKPIRFTEIGCPAVDRGPNQPNVFYDPKSAESFLPYFSRGWRDDAVQRRFLEAALGYWAEPANNPISSVYAGRMITTAETAAWTWDARPYPAFPARSDVWTDADNWRLGHWLNGRLGSVARQPRSRALPPRRAAREPDRCLGAADVVHGYLISAIESPRASIAPLARQFGFDAIESEGVIRFQPRDRRPVATLALDDLAVGERADGEVIELVRAQETELPQALKWQVLNAEEDYDAMTVEARRATGEALRVTSESFAIATIASDADRRCRRAARGVGRPRDRVVPAAAVAARARSGRRRPARPRRPADLAAADQRRRCRRPDNRGGADRCRRVRLAPGRTASRGRRGRWSTGRASRSSTCRSSARASRRTSPSPPPTRCLGRGGRGLAQPRRGRLRACHHLGRPARIGTLVSHLYPGRRRGSTSATSPSSISPSARSRASPTWRSSPAPMRWRWRLRRVWEVLQFGVAELIAPGATGSPGSARPARHRGRHGNAGTGGRPGRGARRGAVAAAGPEAALGLEANWRVGPASKPVSDRSYRRAELHARGRRPAAVLGRPCRAAAHGARARRPRDPLDPPLAGARRRQLECAEAPLAEEAEAYEVEILDGGLVKRTLGTSATSVTYTGTQQTTDWGALLGPGDTL